LFGIKAQKSGSLERETEIQLVVYTPQILLNRVKGWNYSYLHVCRYWNSKLFFKFIGPKGFADIRTVDNVTYDTFREAAIAKG
jgi:hypothetical protein